MKTLETTGFQRIKKVSLSYVNSMKLGDIPGIYTKEKSEIAPSLYGSYHALHILDLFGELNNYSKDQLDKWADFFLEKQCIQGYFSNNPKDYLKTRLPKELNSILHNTRGIIWALRILDRKPKRDFKFMEPALDSKFLYDWVKSFDWSNSWAAGNQVCAIATILFAMRDWFGHTEIDRIMKEGMYPALEELLDEKTGYWGTQFGSNLLNGQFGTIHIVPIYFAQDWPLRAIERNIDSTLACQRSDGSFWPGGSDCPDFDGAYMMMNLSTLSNYRKKDLTMAAKKYLEHALMHEDSNGVGWLLHRKDSTLSDWKPRPHFKWTDGSDTFLMESRDEDPKRTHIMLGSWFYPLSIALISHMLKDTGYEGPYKLNPNSLHECNVGRITYL